MKRDDILAAYNFRHACKSFDSTLSINTDDFHLIMETARLSPSSFGFEPWKFLVVESPALKEELKPVTWGGQGQIPTASKIVICLARKTPYMKHDSDYIQNFMSDIQKLPEEIVTMKGGFFKKFQEEDFKLLESERALFDWSCKQCYIALGNMMTTAAMLGIDSCPMEGFDRDGVEAILAKNAGVDLTSFGVAYMVAFGYRENEPMEKTRQGKESVIEVV
ncbi:NAD(P)H-dependent oxidoreductase [Desulfoluna sp.]|uniref:NAD(P)H-dependent oxidoreductase n=1 Tax=Desulfoluna sp. TaxID=2045199 RepID=UPI002628B63D|nr:NAD(P)H-dependent oxidoreductase [Desulfoluna sp.]